MRARPWKKRLGCNDNYVVIVSRVLQVDGILPGIHHRLEDNSLLVPKVITHVCDNLPVARGKGRSNWTRSVGCSIRVGFSWLAVCPFFDSPYSPRRNTTPQVHQSPMSSENQGCRWPEVQVDSGSSSSCKSKNLQKIIQACPPLRGRRAR